jgi:hypothetical protein
MKVTITVEIDTRDGMVGPEAEFKNRDLVLAAERIENAVKQLVPLESDISINTHAGTERIHFACLLSRGKRAS